MMVRTAITLALLLASSYGLRAQPAASVQSLLSQEFVVVAAVASPNGGAGLFLQKKDQLFFCFVSETPSSAALTTNYCKPVR